MIKQIKSGEVEAGLNELLEKVTKFFQFGPNISCGWVSGEGGLRRWGQGEGQEEEQEQGLQLQVHRTREGCQAAWGWERYMFEKLKFICIYVVNYTNSFSLSFELNISGALHNVKELQKKSELWKFTQKLEVSHVTN